ncbi:MAG TPA: hypothetical protein VL424_08875 [Pararobbsia sp.]|nr:hypothetical protein [Pararobbsia sp.]
MDTQDLTQGMTQNITQADDTRAFDINDPLAPENLKDPLCYEDLLPYLLLPIAGCW